jgi:MFS family permease
MMSMPALGLMIGAFASGRVLELTGARSCMALSLLVFGVFGAAGLFPIGANLLMASRFIVGFATACLATACMWVIAERYESDTRARVIGIANATGSIGSMSGLLIGGWLAQHFDWRTTFWLYPACAAVALAFTALGAPRAKPQIDPNAKGGGFGFFGQLWPLFLLAALVMSLVFLGAAQIAFLLSENGVKDVAVRSAIMSTNTISCAVFSFLYGPIQARLKPLPTFVLALAALCVGLFSIGFGYGAIGPAIGTAGLGMFCGLALPYLMHAVTLRAPEAERGRAIGTTTAFLFIGTFANPLLFALPRAWFGLHGMFIFTGVVMTAFILATAVRAFSAKPAAAIAPAA